MKSLIALQPGMGDLGAGSIRVTPYTDDPTSIYGPNQDLIRTNIELEKKLASGSTVVTQSPEEMLAVARRYAFLTTTRPGPDYGAFSGVRNALYLKEGGLGELNADIFGAIMESVKKSAPEAFKGVKGSELLPSISLPGGPKLSLPSWLPKISLPSGYQKAGSAAVTLGKKVYADVKAKQAASANSASGVAAQTAGHTPSPTASLIANPWVLGGAGVAAYFLYLATKGRR